MGMFVLYVLRFAKGVWQMFAFHSRIRTVNVSGQKIFSRFGKAYTGGLPSMSGEILNAV